MTDARPPSTRADDQRPAETTVGELPPEAAERRQRLRDNVAGLRARAKDRPDLVLHRVGGVLAPLGIVLILLGWYGTARTPWEFQQLPYVVSGGILGLGLVVLGAGAYFTYWVTQLLHESRAQTRAMIDAIEKLGDRLDAVEGRAPTGGDETTPTAPEPIRRQASGPATVNGDRSPRTRSARPKPAARRRSEQLASPRRARPNA